MLLYWVMTLVRLLLANAINWTIGCLVLHLLDQFMPFTTIEVQLLMHLSQGIRDTFHHRTNMHLYLLVPLLFHKPLAMFCSRSVLILQLSVCIEPHIFLMFLKSICSCNPSCPATIVAPYLDFGEGFYVSMLSLYRSIVNHV